MCCITPLSGQACVRPRRGLGSWPRHGGGGGEGGAFVVPVPCAEHHRHDAWLEQTHLRVPLASWLCGCARGRCHASPCCARARPPSAARPHGQPSVRALRLTCVRPRHPLYVCLHATCFHFCAPHTTAAHCGQRARHLRATRAALRTSCLTHTIALPVLRWHASACSLHCTAATGCAQSALCVTPGLLRAAHSVAVACDPGARSPPCTARWARTAPAVCVRASAALRRVCGVVLYTVSLRQARGLAVCRTASNVPVPVRASAPCRLQPVLRACVFVGVRPEGGVVARLAAACGCARGKQHRRIRMLSAVTGPSVFALSGLVHHPLTRRVDVRW
jgi:hypothetical protein